MPSLVISSLTFDKASYTTGETVTATVLYENTNVTLVSYPATVTVTDTQSNVVQSMDGPFTVSVPDISSASISDTGKHAWVKVSDDGYTRAVFTTVA